MGEPEEESDQVKGEGEQGKEKKTVDDSSGGGDGEQHSGKKGLDEATLEKADDKHVKEHKHDDGGKLEQVSESEHGKKSGDTD